MYRHVFFDVDKTLTRSRSEITPEMADTLEALASRADVIVVSGAQEKQIWKQLTQRFTPTVYILAQNGNYARLPGAEDTLWADELTPEMRRDIEEHIEKIRREFSDWFLEVDENDLVDDRGCQISFSLYGHNAPVEEKERFDPDCRRRKQVLTALPFESEHVEVKIGGTTTLDYFKKGSTKGTNVERLARYLGWDLKECVYIGDGLFPGGNDESVIGVCDTIPVADQNETFSVIETKFLGR